MGKHVVSMIAVVMWLTTLISGCTINLVPSKIPPLDTKTEGLTGPFDNITVTLVNAQPDDSNFSVKDLNGKDTGWVLSRRLWTEKLVEALGAELLARQGKVVGGAPDTLSLKITEVVYPRETVSFSVIPFRVTAIVNSNSDWIKTYVGSEATSQWIPSYVSGDSTWNRSANWTIRDVVLRIMSDPEFIAQISKQK